MSSHPAATDRLYVAQTVGDLYNSLPTMFGFRPEESLVAVTTHGPRRRAGFRLRIDLPPPHQVEEAAELVLHHLHQHAVDGVVLATLGRDQAVSGTLLRRIVAGLEPRIDPVVVARSDGRRYWLDDEPGFPAAGVEYSTSDDHESIVSAIVAGQEIVPTRNDVVRRYAPVSGARRAEMIERFEQVLPELLAVIDGSAEPVAQSGLFDLLPIVDQISRGEPLDDEQVVRLCVWTSSSGVHRALEQMIGPDSAERWLPVLAHAARLVVPPYEATVLSLAALAAWQTGDGAQALIAAERAYAADPELELARTMMAIVIEGVPPGRMPLG